MPRYSRAGENYDDWTLDTPCKPWSLENERNIRDSQGFNILAEYFHSRDKKKSFETSSEIAYRFLMPELPREIKSYIKEFNYPQEILENKQKFNSVIKDINFLKEESDDYHYDHFDNIGLPAVLDDMFFQYKQVLKGLSDPCYSLSSKFKMLYYDDKDHEFYLNEDIYDSQNRNIELMIDDCNEKIKRDKLRTQFAYNCKYYYFTNKGILQFNYNNDHKVCNFDDNNGVCEKEMTEQSLFMMF